MQNNYGNGEMRFGEALDSMLLGRRVYRRGWNGKDMFIFYTEGRTIPNDKARSFAHFKGDNVTLGGHIDMKDAMGVYVSGWTPSQADMMANDWQVIID